MTEFYSGLRSPPGHLRHKRSSMAPNPTECQRSNASSPHVHTPFPTSSSSSTSPAPEGIPADFPHKDTPLRCWPPRAEIRPRPQLSLPEERAQDPRITSMYYNDFDSPSPSPSQTADPLGWESEGTPAPMDSREATPTQAERPASPASVVEINKEDFPALEAPTPIPAAKGRSKGAKGKKGKGKEKKTTPAASDDEDPFLSADLARATAASLGSEASIHTGTAETDTNTTAREDAEAPYLAADLARTTAASLGMQTSLDNATTGASSLRRPAAAPGSPPKRQRANSAGDTAPAPLATASNTAPAPAPVSAPPSLHPRPHLLPRLRLPPRPLPLLHPPPSPHLPSSRRPLCRCTCTARPAPALADCGRPPAPWLVHPHPAGGFPPIVYSPELLLQGVPPDLVQMYEAVPFPKLFLVVSGGNGAVMRTHGHIRNAIGNFVNVEPTSFTLGTPPTSANGTSPSLWLAADIPGQLSQAILDARIISSSGITLFSIPYDMPVSGFIGVFAGFTLPNTAMGANAARDLIRTAIEGNNEIAQFVQTHRDAFGPLVSAGQAWDFFRDSVAVHAIVLLVNDTNTVAWRLHVTPPTNDRAAWGQLRRLFGKLQIMTALYGTARIQRAFRCRICPAIDHPTPLCLLPSLPGWLGPTPATIAALEEASHAAVAKTQEQIRTNNFGAGSSNPRSGNGRGQGATDSKPRKDGKGKRGGDFKGKGKRRERDDFF
ncbi:hypothetical protein B0H10DRAFT_2210937 [Mycena sp. CBHHK59/15]|nr:hypothetical protein B0H10DRAFT_2210937 [Mycena sp. CBHHK59/15]